MSIVPYRRRWLFADGKDVLYPKEMPSFLYLGTAVESGRHVVLEDEDRSAHVYMCGVTGSGKTRFLENMIVQDITRGHPLCLIDPTGGLYRKALEFIAYCAEIAGAKGVNVERQLERYLFLDIDDPNNPLRVNPLEPQGGETTEELVDDFLKVAERLFGSVDEMRRLRNTLRNTLWVIAELNQMAPSDRPALEGYQYPLNLRFAAEFLSAPDEFREQLVNAIPDNQLNAYVKVYWSRFFSQYTQSQKQERLESTWNILQYFLGDTLVSRFFDTQESTFHIPELLSARRSLFCHLPLGKNLKGCRLIGTFIATKFQHAAYRRPPTERRQPYYLYIDEFHEFADIEFAKAAATLRQYNLRMINAHQSQSQPPFHTAEGRSILETIKANAQVKVLFRLAREDAEVMTKELFELSQCRHNFTYQQLSTSIGATETTTETVSFQRSRSVTRSASRAKSVAIAETETYSIARTEGTTIGETLTEGFGETITEGISQTITENSSETVTEMHSKAHGISVVLGKNWGHMVNHNTGFTYTASERESLAVQRGLSRTHTSGRQSGVTETKGRDFKVTDGHGNNFVSTTGAVAYHHRGEPAAARETGQTSSSSAMGQMSNHSRSEGESFSKAMQQLRTDSEAIARSSSETATSGIGRSLGQSESRGTGRKLGGSRQDGVTDTDTVSNSLARMRGRSVAEGRSRSISESHEISLAKSFQQLLQFSQSYSEALQHTRSATETIGHSEQEGTTEGISAAVSRGSSETVSVSEETVFFSLEGERELSINDLQKLPQRRCVVAMEALAALEVETYTIPDGYFTYWRENLPAKILREQKERLAPGLPEYPPLHLVEDEEVDEVVVESTPWAF